MREGTCDRETSVPDPLTILKRPHVDPDIGPSGLLALRHCEFMPFGREVPQPVHLRSRSVGDDTLVRCPFPRRDAGSELEPGRP